MSFFIDDCEQRFIAVYHEYISEIYQYVYLRTGFNQVTAEDITQEIFIAVYKGFSKFKGFCSMRTWIFKIAKNKVCDYYREQYSPKFEIIETDDYMADILEDPTQDLEEILYKSFVRERVHTCLNQLSEQYRIVLILKYIDDRSVKEIASFVGKSPKAIESVLQRAKAAFVKKYNELDREEESL